MDCGEGCPAGRPEHSEGDDLGAVRDLLVAARRYAQVRRARRSGAGHATGAAHPAEPGVGAGAVGNLGAAHAAEDAAAAAEPAAFLAGFEDLIAKAPPGVVRRHALVSVPADRPPWTDTGLDLAEGDHVTIFGAGRAWLSKPLDLWVGPQFQLWARVGEAGPIFNGVHDSHSFVAERAGRLYLASYFPGQWGDPTGRVSTDLGAYRGTPGCLAAAVVVWGGEAADGLAALGEGGDVAGQITAARVHLHEDVSPPAGWHYLWLLGRSAIFHPAERDGRPAIFCRTHGDVGILQKEVSLPLQPGTRLRWAWRVDALPSELPEDSALSHDYLSLAVELSDGRDITYTWSRSLAVETSYWCPLPTWKDREHHVVVRSGPEGLGDWQTEERDLYADVAARMGPPPARIVRVWLIAVSLFQRREGRCTYANIEIESEENGDGVKLIN